MTFKPYSQGQMMLPTSLDELLPEGHLARIISEVVDRIRLDTLLGAYEGGGASSYSPRMMMKIVIYAYTEKIYTSRQMAKAVREQIPFMWLAGENRPEYRTLNRFRTGRMAALVDAVSAHVLEYLAEHGYVRLETYFVDGTKLLADANRNQAVWAKNVKRYKERLKEKIAALLAEARRANAAEETEYGNRDLEQVEAQTAGGVTSESLKKCVETLNERLKAEAAKNPQAEGTKRLAKATKVLEREYLPRLEGYEKQEETLDGRNSYAKTDEGATFMRMKEDRLGTGTVKPAYNVQIGTENQFIVGFSVHQNAADSACLIPHLQAIQSQTKQMPACIVADAGYGTEQNYAHLEKAGVGNYMKYPSFDLRGKAAAEKRRYHVDTWTYDETVDEYVCPQNKRLSFVRIKHERSSTGYVSERRCYECHDCADCPVKTDCTKARANRVVEVSPNLIRLRAQAAENLRSERGVKLRAKRSEEPESVFGHLKHNHRFRRFHVRGLNKVRTEFGILCIAHNMRKLAA